MKVAILVPSMSEVKADFAMSLAAMCGYTAAVGGYHLAILNEKSSMITAARNNLVRKAIDLGFDKALFLDSDMKFQPDALVRLAGHNVQIVAATYNKRVHPYTTLGTFPQPITAEHEGLVPATTLPGGIMMIDRAVFDKFPSPWFRETYETAFVSADNPDGIVGEDINFCRSAKKAGVDIWCDLDVTYGAVHIGENHVGMGRPETVKAAA